MKEYLAVCLLILFAMSLRAAEQPPEFPASDISLAAIDAVCVPQSRVPPAKEDLTVEGGAFDRIIVGRNASEAQIEYLMSYFQEDDWVLKTGSEIQLYLPPEPEYHFFPCSWIFTRAMRR